MKTRFVVLGFGLPDELKDEVLLGDPGMPTQTFKFADNLKESLIQNHSEIFLVSTEPVMNYPANSNAFFKFKRFTDSSGVKGIVLPFINLFILKHLTRFLSGLALLSNILKKSKFDAVIVHGIHSPFLVIACLMKVFFKIKIICIVTDPPVTPKSSGCVEIQARRLDRFIIFYFLKKFDGLIVLSELFIKDNNLSLPYIVLDGFCDNEKFHNDNVDFSDNEKFTFAYAGGLSEEYGVKRLVQAAVQLENIELFLYGKGPLSEYLTEMSSSFSNINYMGFTPPEKIACTLLKADCLVNPRPSSDSFVRYSFPSKVIEYLALGVPLLTTHLPSMSDDYLSHVLVINDETVSGIVNSLRDISSMSKLELNSISKRGQAFVFETRSCTAQGLKINQFFNSI